MYTSTSPIYNIPLYTEIENAYRHIKSKRRISYDRIYQLIRYIKVNLNVCLPKLPFRDLYMKIYCVHCYGGMIACSGRLGVCVCELSVCELGCELDSIYITMHFFYWLSCLIFCIHLLV